MGDEGEALVSPHREVVQPCHMENDVACVPSEDEVGMESPFGEVPEALLVEELPDDAPLEELHVEDEHVEEEPFEDEPLEEELPEDLSGACSPTGGLATSHRLSDGRWEVGISGSAMRTHQSPSARSAASYADDTFEELSDGSLHGGRSVARRKASSAGDATENIEEVFSSSDGKLPNYPDIAVPHEQQSALLSPVGASVQTAG